MLVDWNIENAYSSVCMCMCVVCMCKYIYSIQNDIVMSKMNESKKLEKIVEVERKAEKIFYSMVRYLLARDIEIPIKCRPYGRVRLN